MPTGSAHLLSFGTYAFSDLSLLFKWPPEYEVITELLVAFLNQKDALSY